MTDAQWKADAIRISNEVNYKFREFRKECITQGIVKIVRDFNFYKMEYRGHFVCYLFEDENKVYKLRAAWNVIHIAEQLLKAEQFAKGLEGVENESN